MKNIASYGLSDLLMRRGIKDQNHNITPEMVYCSNLWSLCTKYLSQTNIPLTKKNQRPYMEAFKSVTSVYEYRWE